MSIGPVSGNGIPVNLPQGKIVFWSVLVQSSLKQFVQIQDSKGNPVFTVQGASGSGGNPTQIGEGFFQAGDPTGTYKAFIGIDGGRKWSQVIYTQDVIANGPNILFGKYVFTSEDATDNDYNDSYLQLQWFQYIG